jgi:hypothetical protein
MVVASIPFAASVLRNAVSICCRCGVPRTNPIIGGMPMPGCTSEVADVAVT